MYVCMHIHPHAYTQADIHAYMQAYIHALYLYLYKHIPVVPARGGAEVALDLTIRPFSSIELARAVRRACLLCANLLCCCCSRTWPACDHVATQHQANIFFTLHTALFTPCTSRFTLALHIPQLILSQIIWFLLTSCHLIWPLLISSHPFSHII